MSSLIGEGGTGKTALRYAQYLSLAIGRSLLGDHVYVRSRVLIISLEDDADELRRRIAAVLLHYGIAREELDGWLFLAALRRGDKLMVLDKGGRPVAGALAAKLERVIVEQRIDLVALDPFIKTHSVGENDNNAIDAVVDALTDLAVEHDIAIDAPHHMGKGPADPGNANRGRGASSMKDAARLVHTLTPMSRKEAEALGVDECDRRRLIRMDSGKVNITPAAIGARWFRLVGVPLDNATELYPEGDVVQTVEPWEPTGLSAEDINAVLAKIAAGAPNGERYSDAAAAGARAAWRVIVQHNPAVNEMAARGMIKQWVDAGWLVVEEYDSPAARRKVKGLRVDTKEVPL